MTAHEPQITIAIPFHRGLSYLKEAIESVLAQKRSEWRLLVCDDGSLEPGAAELVSSYADRRVACHANPEQLGMVENWNRCIDLAGTDLVTLLHADDRLEPDYADTMLEVAARHPDAAAYFCDARIIDAAGEERFSLADAVKRHLVPRGPGDVALSGEPGVRALMRGNFIMCPTLCFRKSVLDGARFSGIWKQVQDLDFTTRLLMSRKILIGARRVAYAYRRHPESATSLQTRSLLRFEEEFALFGQIANHAEELGWSKASRVSRRRTIIRMNLLYSLLRDLARLPAADSLARLRLLLRRDRSA